MVMDVDAVPNLNPKLNPKPNPNIRITSTDNFHNISPHFTLQHQHLRIHILPEFGSVI